jgi:hypothetical protein
MTDPHGLTLTTVNIGAPDARALAHFHRRPLLSRVERQLKVVG